MIGPTHEAPSPGRPTGPQASWLTYLPDPGVPDELFDPAGGIRAHWSVFRWALEELGPAELTRRWREAQRLIRENGVAGNPRGTNPWQLDPLPLLIAADEAQSLERGLIQRGRLLEALMHDLYGEQRSLAEGLLPRELVVGNPAYLGACRHVAVAGSRYVHFYATHVGRAADGTFRVLEDHTQAPSGAAYVLENRLALSRVLPDAFRDSRVERLAPFFLMLRDTLRSIAPHNRDNPRIVLLTPGPDHEAYFEHAYLARYLGYALIEGGDLAVRGSRVFLKVLGGLQPVDVILRRLDDELCDPLELRPDSMTGVPGLVQAVRSGNVAVANALGTGLLETPALHAFLPALCRRFLDEDLLLPSAATWWCGDARACEHVVENLSSLVIGPAHPGISFERVVVDQLTAAGQSELAARIRAAPHDYIAQERLTLSTAPAFINECLEPRRFVLRTYLAAHHDSFVVLPGGLTTFSGAADAAAAALPESGSKDTWILSDGLVSPINLLSPVGTHVVLSRGGKDLPSRVADHLFRLGRCAERAEGLIRLLRGILVRLTETSGLAEAPELPVLLRAVTFLSDSQPGFVGEGAAERLAFPATELLAIVYDRQRTESVASLLAALCPLAATVRDRISRDLWRVVNDLAEFAGAPLTLTAGDRAAAGAPRPTVSRAPTLTEALGQLDETVLRLAAFSGLATDSVTRGDGWRFLDLGRKLERALHTVSLLRQTLVLAGPIETPLLEALLEIADSSMTYRRRYQENVQAPAVTDLLLADEGNPRAVAFQLAAIAEHVERLPREGEGLPRPAEHRLVTATLTAVRLADVNRLAAADERRFRPGLDKLLGEVGRALPAVSDAIIRTYLSH
jgi:uncharacterized circularly permuted ATP-grasp superfamily protein/uncharacterized alpha-E superfamily protein